MANVVTVQSAPQTQAEYEAAFERLMAEAESIDERMRRDRVDIERLKAETNALRDETRAMLIEMDASHSAKKSQWEQQCIRDIAARDQENLILRMENSRLRAERALPSCLF